MKKTLLAGLACALLVSTARAEDEATLRIGDPAPSLVVAEWVKGSPVQAFEPGQAYLIEFWATWCGPCIASMPHLSELQRTYRDDGLTIIGMTSVDKSNSLEKVHEMVEAKGDGMDYSVAWDVERQTNTAYMTAAKQRGIPTGFLIDQAGKVAWIGHPMQLDIPLSHVMAGTWDYEEGPAMMEDISNSRNDIYKAAEPKLALERLLAFKQKYPVAAKGMESLHFNILASLPKHAEEAQRLGHELVAKSIEHKDSNGLNGFAWTLVDPAVERENRFLDLALLAADKANEFSGKKDPSVLDTVARVHFWRGDLAKALEIQKLAVEHAEGKMKESLLKAVEEYSSALQGKQLSRG